MARRHAIQIFKRRATAASVNITILNISTKLNNYHRLYRFKNTGLIFAASLFPDVECNLVRLFLGGHQINVVSDQNCVCVFQNRELKLIKIVREFKCLPFLDPHMVAPNRSTSAVYLAGP